MDGGAIVDSGQLEGGAEGDAAEETSSDAPTGEGGADAGDATIDAPAPEAGAYAGDAATVPGD